MKEYRVEDLPKPKYVPYLDPEGVPEQYCNDILVAVVFALRPGSSDRFSEENRIIFKQFAEEVIHPDFQSQQLQQLLNCFHEMPLWYFMENGANDTSFEYLRTTFNNSEHCTQEWYKEISNDQQVYKAFVRARSVGCHHYITGCRLKCKLCDKYFGCRRCHDELVVDHTFPKHDTEEVQCIYCGHEQLFSAGNSCLRCHHHFGDQVCDICRFMCGFNNDAKPYYHCCGCDACNVGFRELSVHCDTCRCCINKALFPKHTCAHIGDCIVCLENLLTSKFNRRELACGHNIHEYCYNKLILKNIYKCPVCKKFIPMNECKHIVLQYQREIAKEKVYLPDRLEYIQVQCNDCGTIIPQIKVLNELYYCPKCQLFNCEVVGDSTSSQYNDYITHIQGNEAIVYEPRLLTHDLFREIVLARYGKELEQCGVAFEQFVKEHFVADGYLLLDLGIIHLLLSAGLPSTITEMEENYKTLFAYITNQ